MPTGTLCGSWHARAWEGEGSSRSCCWAARESPPTIGTEGLQLLVEGHSLFLLSAHPHMVDFFRCWRRTKGASAPNPRPLDPAAAEAHALCVSFQSKNSIFSFEELKISTRDFHPDNKLGEGGFGSVYRGSLHDGTQVAVKKLAVGSRQGKSQFLNEINLLSSVQHRNLVRLLGCSVQGPERLLVYEYLPNSSIDKILFGPNDQLILSWSTRREIILGIARGLLYLHEGSNERIVHRDIKASNILLDAKFSPKIADFGLARLFDSEDTHVNTAIAGTLGYLAPEYAAYGKLSEKADVFSFGVLTLEIVSGRKHTNMHLRTENQRLLDLAWRLYEQERLLELADPRLGGNMVPEEVVRMGHIALLSTQANFELRPSMSRIMALLSGHSKILEKPTEPPFINMAMGAPPRRTHKPRETPHRHRKGASSSLSSSAKGSISSSLFSY